MVTTVSRRARQLVPATPRSAPHADALTLPGPPDPRAHAPLTLNTAAIDRRAGELSYGRCSVAARSAERVDRTDPPSTPSPLGRCRRARQHKRRCALPSNATWRHHRVVKSTLALATVCAVLALGSCDSGDSRTTGTVSDLPPGKLCLVPEDPDVTSSTTEPVAATWSELAASNPDLAAFGQRRLMAAPAYLATIKADGSPRVHPLTPIIAATGLYVFMEPTSPKAADLRARSRFALHCWVPDNAGTGGEFHVSGIGRLVDRVETRAEITAASSYSPADRYILFELLLSEARANGYGDVTLPSESRWKTG